MISTTPYSLTPPSSSKNLATKYHHSTTPQQKNIHKSKTTARSEQTLQNWAKNMNQSWRAVETNAPGSVTGSSRAPKGLLRQMLQRSCGDPVVEVEITTAIAKCREFWEVEGQRGGGCRACEYVCVLGMYLGIYSRSGPSVRSGLSDCGERSCGVAGTACRQSGIQVSNSGRCDF